MSDTRQRILEYIKNFREDYGLNTTVGALVRTGKFGNRTNINQHLVALERQGMVKFIFENGKIRGVALNEDIANVKMVGEIKKIDEVRNGR